MSRRDVIRCVLCLAAILPRASAWADRERDHDRARHAVERGEALPLADILERVRSNLGGEIVGVSFEREHGRWVYEFRVIRPGGALVEVYVDAASGRIVKQEEEH
ncbi:PepSY domain-containing protein [Microvirga sp. M2]